MAINRDSCIAIGNFDGIHLGHDALINKMLEISTINNLKSVILTFKYVDNSMKKNSSNLKYIVDFESKIKMLKSYNVDNVSIIELDEATSKYSPEKFIEKILINKFHAKHIVVGFNFKFGYKAQGNTATLKSFEDKYNYKVDILNPIKYEGEDVSSTRIRNLIYSGNIDEADKLLKEKYTIYNNQLHWINNQSCIIKFTQEIIIPHEGIYKVKLGSTICNLTIIKRDDYMQLYFDKGINTDENIIFLNN